MKQTKLDKRAAMLRRIKTHGEHLLAIFPNATERDPDKLARKLRSLETKGARLAVAYCNGVDHCGREFGCEQWEEGSDTLLAKVNALLGNSAVPVFVNGDARGYALKIESEWLRDEIEREGHCFAGIQQKPRAVALAALHRDWGGYGILAPDLSED